MLFCSGLLPLAVYLVCATPHCSTGESVVGLLVEAGACAAVTFSLLRLVRGLGMRLLLLPVTALVAEALRHTLTVWLF